jgi:hypothetical protein
MLAATFFVPARPLAKSITLCAYSQAKAPLMSAWASYFYTYSGFSRTSLDGEGPAGLRLRNTGGGSGTSVILGLELAQSIKLIY